MDLNPKQINQSLAVMQGRLFLENCDLTDIAKQFGTPLFVVSETHLCSSLGRGSSKNNALTKSQSIISYSQSTQ
jgi:diaminopimelate decarboxylase